MNVWTAIELLGFLVLSLEADLALGKPSELDGCGGHGLAADSVGGVAGGVDGGLPLLKSEPAVDFKILPNPLHSLETDVIQRGSVLRRTGTDEILGCLLISRAQLKPFIPAQMVGDPRLPAFIFAPNPISE